MGILKLGKISSPSRHMFFPSSIYSYKVIFLMFCGRNLTFEIVKIAPINAEFPSQNAKVVRQNHVRRLIATSI